MVKNGKSYLSSYVMIILSSIYILIGWLAEIFQVEYFKRACVIIGIYIGIAYGKVIYGRIPKNIKVLLLLLYVGVIFHNVLYYKSYEGVGSYLYDFLLFPVTIVMSIAFIEFNKKKTTIVLLSVFASTIIVMSVVYYYVFFAKVDPNALLQGSSQNGVGTYLFSSCILYSAVIYIRNKTVDIFIPFFMFIISIYLVGRTVMFVSGMYFFLALYVWISKKKSFILKMLLLVFAAILIFHVFNYYINEDIYNTNLYKSGFDTPRLEIWRLYMNRQDLFSIIFGSPLAKILPEWNGNPHSSYLVMHSKVGIFMLLFVLIIFYSFKECIKNKEYYVLGLMVLLIIRITTDMGYLFTTLDYILFVLIIYPFYKKMFNQKRLSFYR